MTMAAKKKASSLADLAAAPYNPRSISEAALKGLGYSMAEFGDLGGIVWNKRFGTLVAGHQRVKSLRAQYGDLALVGGRIETPEGHSFGVRVVDWTRRKERAANVAANSPTVAGAFTVDLNGLLEQIAKDDAALFEGLQLDGLDDVLAGLDAEADAEALESLADAVDRISEAGERSEEDEAPPVDEEGVPDSKRGEVYELGPHRLMCGDSRNVADWVLLLGGAKANLVFTSPPYASQRKYDETSGFRPIAPDDYGEWWAPLQVAVRENLAADGSFFVNIKEHCQDGQRHLYVKKLTIRMVDEWGWRFVDELCWTRNTIPGAFLNRLKNGWEPVLHFCTEMSIRFRPKAVAHASQYAIDYSADRVFSNDASGYHAVDEQAKRNAQHAGLALPSNVLTCSQDKAYGATGAGHSAPFPVALPSFFVRAFTDEGDIVLDPFMGSGTTLIAAAQHGRRGFGLEIGPRYCDVIRRRWTIWARDIDCDPGPGALD